MQQLKAFLLKKKKATLKFNTSQVNYTYIYKVNFSLGMNEFHIKRKKYV